MTINVSGQTEKEVDLYINDRPLLIDQQGDFSIDLNLQKGENIIKITDKNGKAVAIKSVADDDEIILISQQGIIIRTAAKGIGIIGRATQGVRVMRIEANDKLMAAAKIAKEEI